MSRLYRRTGRMKVNPLQTWYEYGKPYVHIAIDTMEYSWIKRALHKMSSQKYTFSTLIKQIPGNPHVISISRESLVTPFCATNTIDIEWADILQDWTWSHRVVSIHSNVMAVLTEEAQNKSPTVCKDGQSNIVCLRSVRECLFNETLRAWFDNDRAQHKGTAHTMYSKIDGQDIDHWVCKQSKQN